MGTLYERLKKQYKREFKNRQELYPATTNKMLNAMRNESYITELKLIDAMDIHEAIYNNKEFNFLELNALFKA